MFSTYAALAALCMALFIVGYRWPALIFVLLILAWTFVEGGK